jgi:hypothetical protein
MEVIEVMEVMEVSPTFEQASTTSTSKLVGP